MKKVLIATIVALAVSACSTRGTDAPREIWNNYGSNQVTKLSLEKGQALAVFYRGEDVTGPAVNVYVNGDYQTSLLNNSFSSITVCANKQLFTGSFTTNKGFGNRNNGMKYTLQTQQVAYIKVVNGQNGQPEFKVVSEDIAKSEMAGLKQATQTVSRVPMHQCKDIVLENVSISANALFKFDKSAEKDILPEGKKEILVLAEKIKSFEPNQVSKVEVSGYTDSDGSESYNLALSQKRAETVRSMLKNAGVVQRIEAVGYGEAELLVKECSSIRDSAERAACNQPNRRVEITTYGNK